MVKKKAKTAKIILIVLGLSLLGIVALFSIPLVVGMSQGYDSAMIENTLQKDCNCEIVEYMKIKPDSEKLKENFSSGNLNIPVTMELSGCDYSNFEDLKNNVKSVLNEKKLCYEKSILFRVNSFKGEDKEFSIDNCQFNEEN